MRGTSQDGGTPKCVNSLQAARELFAEFVIAYTKDLRRSLCLELLSALLLNPHFRVQFKTTLTDSDNEE